MIRFLLVFFLFSIQFISAQNYERVDSIVSNYPDRFKSIENFADRIASDFTTDLDRTRATYYWISNHITYDFKSLRKKEKTKKIKYKSKTDYESKIYILNKKYAEKALKKNTAVCEGYAQLLKYTLTKLDIICVVVYGYAKVSVSEIGRKRNNSNHAWNAIKLDKQWRLIDATWSTGNSLYNPKFFNFSDTYFLIPPDKLILSHFPDDKQWQLLDNKVSRINYFNFPIIYDAYHNSGLKISNKTTGYITTEIDSVIQLFFTEIDKDKTYYYSFDKSGKSDIIKFVKEKDQFIANIPYNQRRRRNLVISDGQLTLMKFKIKLIKQ